MSIYKTGIWTEGSINERALPEGYTKLEYIESTGTQYIDTGIVGKNNIRAETDVIFTSIPNDGCLLGGRTGNNRIYLFYIYPGKFNLGYGNNYTSTTVPVANQKYNLKAKLNIGEQNLLVDDTNVLTQNVNTTMDSTVNLYLFCNNYGSASYYVSAKVYTLKIWFNDILVRNFIPALRNIDNVPGMYDMITKTFFTNSGTGEFKYILKGVPSDYTIVDYLESSGTQWIDTNVVMSENLSYEAEGSLIQQSSLKDGAFCGTREGGNNNTRYIVWWNDIYSKRIAQSYYTESDCLYECRYNTKYRISMKNKVFSVNGITQKTFTTTVTNPNNLTFALFALKYSATAVDSRGFQGRMYYFKIWDNNILVRNFIPVVRKSDEVAGMYDTITETFFINKGTGTFTAGDVKIETANVKIFKNDNRIEADSFFEI